MIIVSLVIMLFLWHIPSAVVPIVTIPISVLLSFIPLYFMGVTINIMSLAGIAISIGVLVDGAIVEVENAYNKIQRWQAAGGKGDFHAVRLEALMEVGPSVFFSLLVIAVAFLPIFALVDQEGRLFKPLAYSKNLAMGLAAILAVTLDPALRMLFARIEPFTFRPRFLAKLATTALVGTYHPEERHPISRTIFRVYDPACRFVLRHPKAVIARVARARAREPAGVLQARQRVHAAAERGDDPLHADHAAGHLGRAGAGAADRPGQGAQVLPRGRAGLRQGRPRRHLDRPGAVLDDGDHGRAQAPGPVAGEGALVLLVGAGLGQGAAAPALAGPHLLGRADHRHGREAALPRQHQRLDDADQGAHRHALDRHAHPGRHQDLRGGPRARSRRSASELEGIVGKVPGTRSVFAERVTGGYFVDIEPKRDQIARYGLTIDAVQRVIMTAVGGENVTTTIEGRERYSVNIRYPRELRDDLGRLGRVLVAVPAPGMAAQQVPARAAGGHHARLRAGDDPQRERLSRPGTSTSTWPGGTSAASSTAAKKAVAAQLTLPQGYVLQWSGQYENMMRVRERLKVVVPITLVLIFVLLYVNTRSAFKASW